ncbi:MAG: efflux RND transporter periplasmic adaptor subunit [Geobacteraceae bacterium]|nr:efflux RND transporter periplasmic adaptor subunit [Geobacteraceae bacterium]
MERDIIIAGRILDDMTDGVVVIDLSGRIITFNPSAARILGIDSEEALGRPFGEIFLLNEENDDFNQTILDAIYESTVSHNRVVPFTINGKRAVLSLTTTFLKSDDGTDQRMGVIAVFNDITELQDLQEAEQRLAAELKVKHHELQDAYLKTEQGNQQLQAALKKVQVIRITATAFTIILFLGIGLFVWNRKSSTLNAPSPTVAGPGSVTTFPVIPQPVTSSISLTGKLQPLQMVTISSPLAGKVERVMVRYGDVVQAGQPLAAMDVTEARIKYREAQSAYIKAVGSYRQMEKWDSGSEVVRANRSLAKAKLSLETQKKTLAESERLFKKGIIPETEYESARQQYLNQQMDYQTAAEEVKAAIDKGNAGNRKVARYEMENAKARMELIAHDIASAVVVAPVAGIVMKPPGAGQSKEGRNVERGASFQQGEALFAVGDLSGLSINCKVDEVDVTRISNGQKVRVTGDAFPGEQLAGAIQGISAQAEEGGDTAGGKSSTSFGVKVVVDTIPPQLKKRLMVGMTANLEIIIYEKPNALMAPLSAVTTDNGKRYVTRKRGGNPKGAAEKVEVTTGFTTQDMVEIVTGLKPGDLIEIPAPGAGDGKR